MHGLGDDGGVRRQSDVHGEGHHRIVHMPRFPLHAARHGLPGRPDRCHLFEGWQRMPLRDGDVDLRAADELRRQFAFCDLFVDVHQHLHGRTNVVRERRAGHLHTRRQWLLCVQRSGRLRNTSKLYRRGRVGQVHVQAGSAVHGRRSHLRQRHDVGHLLAGR